MNIPIRYIMDRETRQPIVIPDSQMRSFIAVSGTYDQAVLELEPTELNLSQGTRVRITGGIFEGVEGVFVRVRHDRRGDGGGDDVCACVAGGGDRSRKLALIVL